VTAADLIQPLDRAAERLVNALVHAPIGLFPLEDVYVCTKPRAGVTAATA